MGIILAVLTLIVTVGGIKSIANVATKVIPFMVAFFLIGCWIILIKYIDAVPAAFALIMRSAFSPQALEGGILGFAIQQAIRFGVARGLFSNESGLGSAPIAAAAATTSNPVRQGLVSMSQVFWDTIIVCATTGLTLVTCVLKYPERFVNPETGAWFRGATFTAKAFESIPFGPYLLTISIALFAWTTILGWQYYGEKCLEYLTGKKFLMAFRIFYGLIVVLGATMALDLVWDIADAFNAFMAIPNVISLIALSGVIAATTKEYLWDGNLDKLDPEPIPEIKN
jgi:AGCS family alanine or glycine:cation symporter